MIAKVQSLMQVILLVTAFLMGWVTAVVSHVASLEKEYFDQRNAMWSLLDEKERDQVYYQFPVASTYPAGKTK